MAATAPASPAPRPPPPPPPRGPRPPPRRQAPPRESHRSSPPPSSPLPAPSPPPPPAGDGEGGAVMPYFVPASSLLAPRCPQRKKLTAARSVVLFSSPPPSPDLPVEAVIEFLTSPDMVVAAH